VPFGDSRRLDVRLRESKHRVFLVEIQPGPPASFGNNMGIGGPAVTITPSSFGDRFDYRIVVVSFPALIRKKDFLIIDALESRMKSSG
jgi:hypothetical protein